MPKTKTVGGYDDDDLRAIRDEIAEAKDRERTAKKAAADKRKREVQAAENRATKLGIPVGDLKRALKVLALQDELNDMVANVPDDSAETVADMVKALGDFGGMPLGQAAIQAVDKRTEAAQAQQEQEQVEGAAVLDSIVSGAPAEAIH